MGYGGKDLQKRKVLSLEWKSEVVMDDESGELTELMEEVPLNRCGCVVVVVCLVFGRRLALVGHRLPCIGLEPVGR